jgi:hypothetical protein
MYYFAISLTWFFVSTFFGHYYLSLIWMYLDTKIRLGISTLSIGNSDRRKYINSKIYSELATVISPTDN